MMNVAVTAWDGRISPVFDSAKTLMLAEIKDGEVVSRRYESIDPVWISHLADRLRELGVDVLICGAISQTPSTIIEANGIRLIPFIGGAIEEVLNAFARSGRIAPDFLMPGCGRGQRRQGRGACPGSYKEVNAMPRNDRTGPQGLGPGTGRGRGPCQGGRTGTGTGAGTGQGRGKGQGQGRGQGAGTGAGQGRKNR